MSSHIEKANVLMEALPYMQKLSGKTIVVKYGGNAMINEELKETIVEDIALLKLIGANPIVVHGGGPDITNALKSFNIETKFINGLRYTDADTMRIAQMVLVGKTNKEIVSLVEKHGGNAIGISGIDGKCIKCEKKTTTVDGREDERGFVGNIVKADGKVSMINVEMPPEAPDVVGTVTGFIEKSPDIVAKFKDIFAKGDKE